MSRRIPHKTYNCAPLFTKIDIKKATAKRIHHLQSSFERFTESMLSKSPDNPERQQAIYRMQEACVWFCRSIAAKDFKLDMIDEEKIEIREPTPQEIQEKEEDRLASLLANSMDSKENTTKIFVKKSKFTLNKKNK